MTRHNFSRATIKAAKARAGGRCEASGAVYGLAPGARCGASLADGCEVDHWPLPATDEGSNVLSNAVCCCKSCHRFKTSNYDVPMQAKGRRIRRANGPPEDRRKPKVRMRSRNTLAKGRKIPARKFEKRKS